MTLDPRDYDLRRLNIEASRMECPNGPDEFGHWPCDPKGYFGIAECQVCGRIGVLREEQSQDMSHAGVRPGDRSPIGTEAPADDDREPRGSNQERERP